MTIHIIEKDERENDFAELRRLGIKLSVPVPEVFVSRKIENPGCEAIIKDGRSHTWVRNFYNALFAASFGGLTGYGPDGDGGAGSLKIRTQSGDYLNNISSAHFPSLESAGGIILGTGDTAYSFEDYKPDALIAHGTGAGQMTYGTMSHQVPVYTSGTKEWAQTIKRVCNNNSSGAIAVAEVLLVGNYINYTYSPVCARDVLASTDTINVGGQYTVTYTVKLTFPA
ncbi:hypothetical protein M0R72_14005 [Candidatus Pacearchaeota archaeon]|jgi:hypothetical protein|nr:hypothetical protein [Candidatus Pacearchaeota archaeon]